ncbi:cellulose binding domain-containing protein [Paractinoplanes rishiriensis]|uniref:CBM2 domain-containing protein n=1 Tax=Paractinoplanes rishiriensis TaxID=1050105 RepID=A0A919JST4_9ACTN|nr:cellulose binding domain-containing protein [Actinoplanes rishiriensis]GIE93040.1 hypothetical protein Ari01nite_05050 [Actinoplanes rishiriensis]
MALTRRQRLGAAVGAVVLLYVVVGVWAILGRQPDAVSIAPAAPMFPDDPDAFVPPVPVLPSAGGAGESGRPSSAPSAGEPGGKPGGNAGPDQTGGNEGGDRDEQGRRPPPASAGPPFPSPSAGQFTSQYTVTESGSRTFHARVFVTNRGPTTQNWSVRITFAASDQVSVGRTLGAFKRTSGTTFVFSGFNARPGQTEIFGFDATKGVSGPVRPTGCETEGQTCDVQVG